MLHTVPVQIVHPSTRTLSHPPDLSSLADLRPLTNQSYSFASQIYLHFSIQVTYLRFETTTCHLSRSPSYLSTLRRNPENTHIATTSSLPLAISFLHAPSFPAVTTLRNPHLEHQSFHYTLLYTTFSLVEYDSLLHPDCVSYSLAFASTILYYWDNLEFRADDTTTTRFK